MRYCAGCGSTIYEDSTANAPMGAHCESCQRRAVQKVAPPIQALPPISVELTGQSTVLRMEENYQRHAWTNIGSVDLADPVKATLADVSRIKAVLLAKSDQERAFLIALLADLNDRTTKLVYADWLDGEGRDKEAAEMRKTT